MKRMAAFVIAGALAVGVVSAHRAPLAAAGSPPVKQVTIKDNPQVDGEFFYSPRKITIRTDTRVTWTNDSIYPHSVTDKEAHPRFSSGGLDHLIASGQRYSHLFRHAGTFTYYCIIHPGMKATIVVKP